MNWNQLLNTYNNTEFLFKSSNSPIKIVLYGAGRAGKDAYLSFGTIGNNVNILSVHEIIGIQYTVWNI